MLVPWTTWRSCWRHFCAIVRSCSTTSARSAARFGPVTPELSDALADHMNIRRGEVAEVVSFYSYLQLPHDCIRVCTGPVCDCFGARDLLARRRNERMVESP